MNFKNITNHLSEHYNHIDLFVRELDSEKQFFDLTTARIMRCEIVIIALGDNKIIGIAAVERKYGIARSLMMVKKDFQGKGFGKQFMVALLGEAKNTHNMIMAIVDDKNIMSMRMHLAKGYRIVGKRGKLCYIMNPLNKKGLFLYYLIKILFPIMKAVDLVRR